MSVAEGEDGGEEREREREREREIATSQLPPSPLRAADLLPVKVMVCRDGAACFLIGSMCLCGSGFFALFVWRHGVIAAQADIEWTEGECEILSGTFREETGVCVCARARVCVCRTVPSPTHL